jgi:hypothetical protein
MVHGHGHRPWTWTHTMDMDIHHGHGHRHAPLTIWTWTWTCTMDMDIGVRNSVDLMIKRLCPRASWFIFNLGIKKIGSVTHIIICHYNRYTQKPFLLINTGNLYIHTYLSD